MKLLPVSICSIALLLGRATIFGENKEVSKKPMPDFCQMDTRHGELPKGGINYCTPTAYSNILVYLDNNGFPNMMSQEDPSPCDQLELIKKLGEYMNTSPESGTRNSGTIGGLRKYVSEKGYKTEVEIRGITITGETSSSEPVNPRWLRKKFSNGYFAVLRIAWCNYDSESDVYKVIGNHSLTAFDFEKDEMEREVVLIHDPALRSGLEPKTECCSFILVKNGKISHVGVDYSADGYWKLDGLTIKEGANCAIIDEAIVFKISELSGASKNISK